MEGTKQHEAGVVLSADSLSTVTVAKDFPSSESVYSEPPPVRNYPHAYQKPRSNAVQIARIVGVTVVLVSFVLGSFILAAAWVEASGRQCHPGHHVIVQEASLSAPVPSALIQGQDEFQHAQASSSNAIIHPAPSSASATKTAEVPAPAAAVVAAVASPPAENKDEQDKEQRIDSDEKKDSEEDSEDDDDDTSEDEEEEEGTLRLRMPLMLNFDDLAGALLEQNLRSRMNCVVEKRRQEEVVDRQSKQLHLPFGLNLTTDPAMERVLGERMAIFCESGHHQQQPHPQQMPRGLPPGMVVPLPGPIHLPFQFRGVRPQEQQQHHQHIPQPFLIPIPQHAMQAQTHQAQQQQHPMPLGPQMRSSPARLPFPLPPAHPLRMHTTIQVAEAQPVEIHEARVFQPHQIQIEEVHAGMVPEAKMAANRFREARMFPIRVVEEMRSAAAHAQQPQPPQPREALEPPPQQQPHEAPQMPWGHESPADRPHYVQPRSVRSVDQVLHRREKRMKRCACECAC